MADPSLIGAARKTFADVTALLEDAALIAAEGQAVPDLAAARKICDRLIKQLFATYRKLLRLRKRL